MMKKLVIFFIAVLLHVTGYGQIESACWVYPYYEEACAPASIPKQLLVSTEVNTPSTGYHNWWRTVSSLSTGGYSFTAPYVIVGTTTGNYWLNQNHNYTFTTAGTFTANVLVQYSDNMGATWTTVNSFNGGGYPYTYCAYPMEINVKRSNTNFNFYVNGKTLSGNSSTPVDIIRCNGEDIKLDAIVGTGTIDKVETSLESGWWEASTGFTARPGFISPLLAIDWLHDVVFTSSSSPFFPFYYFAPVTYIKVTVRVYGPCDPPPGYTEKTIIYKITEATALVDFMMQGPLDGFGNGCTSWQSRNPTPSFATFPQPVSVPPCSLGWLGPVTCNVQSAVPYVTGTSYAGYQYQVEEISPSPAVLGTASGAGTLPASMNLNSMTSGYFITNYNSIKNNDVFMVTATVNTIDCGPVSASSYFMILDGGPAGAFWKVAPLNSAATNTAMVFPNPAVNTVHFAWTNDAATEGNAVITLTDMPGRTVLQQTVAEAKGTNDRSIDLSSISSGIYFYSVKTSAAEYTGKLVKQ